jgi:hypothetical protein
MNLILVHWSLILDCVVRYGNIMLINGMKFDELTLKLVRTNLSSKSTQNPEIQIIFVAFNLRGSIYFFHGLNIHAKKDATFCLPCFFFNKPFGHPTQRVFTIDGFKNWKKVRDGKNCAFLNHIGKDLNSFHRIAERSYEDLKNQSQHIQNVFENFTSEQIANNQLQLKASIDVVRVLAFQGVAFRGRDESVDSMNHGNFLEILNLMVLYNEQIVEVIAKAPKKCLLHITNDTKRNFTYFFNQSEGGNSQRNW